ncbi:hypothetical protein D3C84_604680 [compost metagenome]
MADAFGVADAPLHGLHAAQTAADHRGPLGDAEGVGQACLAVHPVFHGQHREVGAVGAAGFRVAAAGSGGAVAAAEVVEADDEELAGVDRLAGADAAVPPARLAVVGAVVAGGVVVAGEGVADQHGIAALGVERAVGFVDQLVVGQLAAAGQREGVLEVQYLGTDQADGIFGEDGGHRPCSRKMKCASLKSAAPRGKGAAPQAQRPAASSAANSAGSFCGAWMRTRFCRLSSPLSRLT